MQPYINILRLIDLNLCLLASFLFCLGLILSPWVVRRNVRFFLFYPLWIWGLIKRHLKPEDPYLKIFFFIFSLNSISLLFNVLSGLFFVLPFIFAILLGMNVGIVLFKEIGKLDFLAIFLNPVSLFELPAAWISISVGIKIGILLYPDFALSAIGEVLSKEMPVYIYVIIPLLIISGLIETTMIKVLARKLETRNR
ncbi:MAG: stage II sporulation protein M [Deltaproteobacteria bacterium]|nr:stage II sporulation protein M [Deltaproteobacteria bacterium]